VKKPEDNCHRSTQHIHRETLRLFLSFSTLPLPASLLVVPSSKRPFSSLVSGDFGTSTKAILPATQKATGATDKKNREGSGLSWLEPTTCWHRIIAHFFSMLFPVESINVTGRDRRSVWKRELVVKREATFCTREECYKKENDCECMVLCTWTSLSFFYDLNVLYTATIPKRAIT